MDPELPMEASAVQVFPPSIEYAPDGPPLDDVVPTRATMFGALSAKSRLEVLPNNGGPNIPSVGETWRSSWRNPEMSPTALKSGTPAGGLARSSTTVSSRPSSLNVQ